MRSWTCFNLRPTQCRRPHGAGVLEDQCQHRPYRSEGEVKATSPQARAQPHPSLPRHLPDRKGISARGCHSCIQLHQRLRHSNISRCSRGMRHRWATEQLNLNNSFPMFGGELKKFLWIFPQELNIWILGRDLKMICINWKPTSIHLPRLSRVWKSAALILIV